MTVAALSWFETRETGLHAIVLLMGSRSRCAAYTRITYADKQEIYETAAHTRRSNPEAR